MKIYEHICTECEVTFYTDWVAHFKSNKPNCVNCGKETNVEPTGKSFEIEEDEE